MLVELEKYILSIDKDNLDQLHPEYREKMAILDLEEVKNNNGKCYIAVDNDKADEAVRILKENGEDACVIGEIKAGEKGVELV